MRILSFLYIALLFAPLDSPAQITIDELIVDAGLEEGPTAVRDIPDWRAPQKIVIRDLDDVAERLQAAYPGIQFLVVNSSSAAAANATNADAILGFCSTDIVDAADRLVWIQIFSAGSERCLAVDRVGDGEILLTNMQKMSSPVIGEHAVAMMMSLARGLVYYAKTMEDGTWNRRYARSGEVSVLAGKTVLVAGLGGIGTAVARRAHGLRMNVIATRNTSRSGPDFVAYVGLADELFDLASRADIVVNALPLTDRTRGLFDEAFFDAVKPGALFINVGRGGTVVTDDLVAALNDGRISGAGLDVSDPEPLPASHPLWQMQNVIITPHTSSAGGKRDRHSALLEENVRRFIAGDKLLNVVDAEEGY